MNAFSPFYDVSAAGSMAATVCARDVREPASMREPAPFAAAPRAPCPALSIAACRKAGWRRLAEALVDLVSGPRLPPSVAPRQD
jgi:hypothetical protein